MKRMVAIVIVHVLVFFTVTGCGIGNVDSDRISRANKAALEFLGEDRADLAFTGTSEYCGMRSLEFEIPEVVAISVDEESRISGYKRLDLQNEGKVVITGEDARQMAETFIRQNYHGFDNKEMLLYRDYCGQVGLEGFDFDVKPRAEARHAELRFDYLPWSLNKEPRIDPYWKVTLQLTGRDGSRQLIDVNIDAVTGEQRKKVGKFPYFQ